MKRNGFPGSSFGASDSLNALTAAQVYPLWTSCPDAGAPSAQMQACAPESWESVAWSYLRKSLWTILLSLEFLISKGRRVSAMIEVTCGCARQRFRTRSLRSVCCSVNISSS